MNRKQKKNKQRIAREHTKKQANIYMTPFEKECVHEYKALDYGFDEFKESGKQTSKLGLVIVVICVLITLWMAMVNT